MIDKFCDWITKKIKGKIPEIDEEKELVINFGVRLLFGEIPKILALFILGFLLQIGWYTLLLYLLLAPYRSFTGGFHLNTHWGCMISSIVLYIMPILIAKYIIIPQDYIIYIITTIVSILSISVIMKYAPADTENIPILSKKERKVKKIKSYISLVVLLAIIIFVPDKTISGMLLYGIFLQDLTLTPIAYKLTKNKYSYEVYTEESI
ncbi:MAG: accessory gene regulator B family protein [Bacilli bacterium]|nr:accessory gene regulator B family protein [Bacilli bacterium]